ncbi:transposase [Agrobacterium fabrum]|uniref:transposase n=1 Tax=Agrobacterium fabrum TaxID=1176649 RepID=UPI000A814A64|nr:transposase [Agrobacterium fabrum]
MNLLINAIVYWNTLYFGPAFGERNREGIPAPSDVIKPSPHSDGSTPVSPATTFGPRRTAMISGRCGRKLPFSQHDHPLFSKAEQIRTFVS